MPYKLRKAPNRNLYWVVTSETGKKHSKDPIPIEKAKAQMRVLESVLAKEMTGGADPDPINTPPPPWWKSELGKKLKGGNSATDYIRRGIAWLIQNNIHYYLTMLASGAFFGYMAMGNRAIEELRIPQWLHVALQSVFGAATGNTILLFFLNGFEDELVRLQAMNALDDAEHNLNMLNRDGARRILRRVNQVRNQLLIQQQLEQEAQQQEEARLNEVLKRKAQKSQQKSQKYSQQKHEFHGRGMTGGAGPFSKMITLLPITESQKILMKNLYDAEVARDYTTKKSNGFTAEQKFPNKRMILLNILRKFMANSEPNRETIHELERIRNEINFSKNIYDFDRIIKDLEDRKFNPNYVPQPTPSPASQPAPSPASRPAPSPASRPTKHELFININARKPDAIWTEIENVDREEGDPKTYFYRSDENGNPLELKEGFKFDKENPSSVWSVKDIPKDFNRIIFLDDPESMKSAKSFHISPKWGLLEEKVFPKISNLPPERFVRWLEKDEKGRFIYTVQTTSILEKLSNLMLHHNIFPSIDTRFTDYIISLADKIPGKKRHVRLLSASDEHLEKSINTAAEFINKNKLFIYFIKGNNADHAVLFKRINNTTLELVDPNGIAWENFKKFYKNLRHDSYNFMNMVFVKLGITHIESNTCLIQTRGNCLLWSYFFALNSDKSVAQVEQMIKDLCIKVGLDWRNPIMKDAVLTELFYMYLTNPVLLSEVVDRAQHLSGLGKKNIRGKGDEGEDAEMLELMGQEPILPAVVRPANPFAGLFEPRPRQRIRRKQGIKRALAVINGVLPERGVKIQKTGQGKCKPPYHNYSKGKASAFVLTCIDPRYTFDVAFYLHHKKELHQDYDLFTLAGASVGASKKEWTKSFFDNLELGIKLHGIKEVWCFDHLDCGMYKATFNLKEDLDPKIHIQCMDKLKTLIKKKHPELKFRKFMVNAQGHVFSV